MTKQQHPEGVSRRNFLRFAGVTVAAAAVTGGGAAYLKRYEKASVISTGQPLPPVYPTAAPYVPSAPVISDIIPTIPAASGDDALARLAASQAEVVRLQAVNDQLQRDLAAMQAAEGEGRVARESLTLELEDARNRLGVLGGLVALYQQLDEADMGGIVENGLGAVGEKLGELLGGTPSLLAGLDAGDRALGEVEAHLPLLENGRMWLDAQGSKLRGFYGEVENRLQQAVERAGDFFEMLASWFDSLRRWLPFSAGEKAAEVMRSMTALLAEMPGTISGLDTNLAQPLDVWLRRDEGQPALTRQLVKPLREGVLAEARTTADRANTVSTVYEQQLAAPSRAALNNRQTLRQQIAEYRAQHQI